jgi:hypothetical protein
MIKTPLRRGFLFVYKYLIIKRLGVCIKYGER